MTDEKPAKGIGPATIDKVLTELADVREDVRALASDGDYQRAGNRLVKLGAYRPLVDLAVELEEGMADASA